MFIPANIIKAFKKPAPKEEVVVEVKVEETISIYDLPQTYFGMHPSKEAPVGCDPSKTEIKITKPTRKRCGRFLSVYYKKESQKLGSEILQKIKGEAHWGPLKINPISLDKS